MEKLRSHLPFVGRKYTSVHNRVLFMIAWKNLSSKKLRSLLTIFGVVIGIGAIFFLLSFGLGLQKLVTDEVIGDQSIKSVDVASPNSRLITLDDSVVNKIKSYPHVVSVGAQYSFSGSLKRSGAEVDTVVYGLDKSYQDMMKLNLTAGRLLKKEDFKAVVLNLSALKAIGIDDPKAAINQGLDITVPLHNTKSTEKEISDVYTIVGVINSGSGSEIFMPSWNFSRVGVTSYKNIKLVADDTSNVPTLRKQIESLGMQTESPVDTLDQINQIFKFFTFVLIGFGSIGMIVSILGMFNTMTISLLERTKEIGLMMALGARNKDMRKLFIFEAVIISLAGALIGIFIAIICGQIVNFFMNNFSQKRGVNEGFQLFSSPLWAIALLTGFTVIVGLMVVYLPAQRAKKINPIEALRRE